MALSSSAVVLRWSAVRRALPPARIAWPSAHIRVETDTLSSTIICDDPVSHQCNTMPAWIGMVDGRPGLINPRNKRGTICTLGHTQEIVGRLPVVARSLHAASASGFGSAIVHGRGQ